MEFWHGRGCHRDFDCAVMQVIRSEMWLSLTLDLRDANVPGQLIKTWQS